MAFSYSLENSIKTTLQQQNFFFSMSGNNYYHLSKYQKPRHNQLPQQPYPQEYNDFCVFTTNMSTESPSTISSPISPTPAPIYNQHNLIGAPNFDLTFSNYYYDSSPQPHQPWTTPQPTTQYVATENTVFDCFLEPPTTTTASHQLPNMSDFTTELFPTDNNNIPIDNYLTGPPPTYFEDIHPSTSENGTTYQNKDERRAPEETHRYSTRFISASVSPYDRPLSSPILSNKRKRRSSTTASWQPTMSMKPATKAESPKSNQYKKSKTTAADVSPPSSPIVTVDQLENELSFLRDDCATILMMLDSLRNAFSASNNKVSSMGTSTLDFSTKRRTSAPRNPEMEKEMRIAYDDLMLQVRQLERKVERLEDKRKAMYLLENQRVLDNIEEEG